MKSASVIGLLLLALSLMLTLWAFKPFSDTPSVDAFLKLIVVLIDVFLVVAGTALIRKNQPVKERLSSLIRNNEKLVILYFGLGFCLAVLIAVEFSCRFYFKYGYEAPYTEKTTWNPAPNEPDSLLGSRLIADTTIEHSYTVNDTLIYRVDYEIDEYRRRITPSFRPDSAYTQFTLVTGCSFAFGYGLSQRETLPYLLDSISGLRCYNYGNSGFGTQQTLALLQSTDLTTQISQPNGVLAYLFIDDHISRLIGSRKLIKLWAQDFPYYCLDGSSVARNGSFSTGRPTITSIYKLLSKSAFIDLFDIDIPWYRSNKHIELFGAVMSESKQEFIKQFPESRFLVVVAPNSKLASRVVAELDSRNIEVLNLSALLNKNDSVYQIHWTEAHPNANYYREIAIAIDAYLKR